MAKRKITPTEYVDNLIAAHWARPRDKTTPEYLCLRQNLIRALLEWIRPQAKWEEANAVQFDAQGRAQWSQWEILVQRTKCWKHLRGLMPKADTIPALLARAAGRPRPDPLAHMSHKSTT
jgi:hypothetical protein